MAGTKNKTMILFAAVSMGLLTPKAASASDIQRGAEPPATSPASVINLTAEDLAKLEAMGLSTTQAEMDAEVAALQEVYGPIDERGLQRRVDRDMSTHLGADYAGRTDAQRAYLASLEERYGRNAGNPDRIRLTIMQDENTEVRLKMPGIALKERF